MYGELFAKYLETIENENSRRNNKYIANRMNKRIYPDTIESILFDFDEGKIVEAMRKYSPNGRQVVSNVLSTIKNYSFYLYDCGMNVVEAIKFFNAPNIANMVWDKIKDSIKKKKYISKNDFYDFLDEIVDNADKESAKSNGIIVATMFRCLWEGVYDGDLTFLSDIRESNLNDDGTITFSYHKGGTHTVRISERLANDLRTCVKINTWVSRNSRVLYEVPIVGKEYDSCFKVAVRANQTENMVKHNYYKKMSKCAKDILGNTIKPVNIMYSGIIARCIESFEMNGIDLHQYLFEYNNMDRDNRNKANGIIDMEMIRLNMGADSAKIRMNMMERIEDII